MSSPPLGSSFQVHDPRAEEIHDASSVVDEEPEEEVDQLFESESEHDPQSSPHAPKSASTGGKRPIPVRAPGTSFISADRLENILRTDGATNSLGFSKEGMFMLTVATEEFMKRLTQGAHRQATVQRRTAVTYRDMAATAEQYQEFMFLKEAMPMPIPLANALKMRDIKERAEAIGEDLGIPSTSTTPGTSQIPPPPSKPKTKSRMANGRDKANGASERSTPGSFDSQQMPWGYDNGRGKSILDNRPWASWATHPGGVPAQAMPHASSASTNGHHPLAREDDPMDGSSASVPHDPRSHSYSPSSGRQWAGNPYPSSPTAYPSSRGEPPAQQ